ncbi:MAG: glycosyltransferase family 4 protein [Candidatus Sulfotelmatobacter sp.]
MLTVAYLANELPCAVEPYVMEEIGELRKRGVRVIAASVWRPHMRGGEVGDGDPQLVLQRLRPIVLASAALLCVRGWARLAPLMKRILYRGREGFVQRLKALAHTVLGVCYAALLKERGVEHIHVHHGYFGSWIAMTAARLLGVEFSMTLHGSDLLMHGAYLDTKLAHCAFCLTISEYNRNYILRRYPGVDPRKVLVGRMGVDVGDEVHPPGLPQRSAGDSFNILTVGRLHAVKDQAFLVRACSELAARGVHFKCDIAGEGPERKRLERLISSCGLSRQVRLLGYTAREETNALYYRADLMVITSRSEGIPLVLMEAMARGKIVLAPAITGIPELVVAGETGFLYQPGSMHDFVEQVLWIQSLSRKADRHCCSPPVDSLGRIGCAAQEQVRQKFNGRINLERFAETFIERVRPGSERRAHENPVLQQVQLSLQRDRSLPVSADGIDAVAGP